MTSHPSRILGSPVYDPRAATARSAKGIHRMILGDNSDFRASIDPKTAPRRLEHFRKRQEALVIANEQAGLDGAQSPAYQSARYQYGRLLEAHIDFAQAQIKELDAARAAAPKEVDEALNVDEAAPSVHFEVDGAIVRISGVSFDSFAVGGGPCRRRFRDLLRRRSA